MKVVGFCGYSGSGKTTLVEQLIVRLKRAELRVSVVKHAHHDFDIDHEGKDSWRHRQAGAGEVVIASSRRMAKMREFEAGVAPNVHTLISELNDCDWVLVEGFKRAALSKIEVWRATTGKPALYPDDAHVVAVCTDTPARLPQATQLPVLDLNDPDAVVAFLLCNPERYEYVPPHAAPSADALARRSAEPPARRGAAAAID
jgi:molybdopterin-guanine dinucleotide biosynthesis adapter protein